VRGLNGGDRRDGVDELVSARLLERCRDGDERAWAELVEATYREVYSLCLRILRDPDDAAEATQEAYVKAWRGLKGFRGDARFTTWMYRVATNAAITTQRSRKRRWSHETEADHEMLVQIAGTTSTEDAAGTKLELRAVERALSTLPEHYRSAVVLRDVYGFSIEEIAKQLDISETAAKVRVHRGRKRLKEAMWPGGIRDDVEERT
jgi:RNA polymerase sigma-70 factor (ECF subfamily)